MGFLARQPPPPTEAAWFELGGASPTPCITIRPRLLSASEEIMPSRNSTPSLSLRDLMMMPEWTAASLISNRFCGREQFRHHKATVNRFQRESARWQPCRGSGVQHSMSATTVRLGRALD
jgi:hypothetical protein